MVSPFEQNRQPHIRKENSLEALLTRVPEAISFAKIEMEAAKEAQTPEGKYALTYLLATRKLLRPLMTDLHAIHPDLLRPTGGSEYNPERKIDEIGTAVAFILGRQTADIPNFFLRTEESPRWERLSNDSAPIEDSDRFAIIDPLDESSGIPLGNRVQSTGVAIYNKRGELLTIGIMSLVDDDMMLVERTDDRLRIVSSKPDAPKPDGEPTSIRVATLTRRMHALKHLPLFTTNQATWTLPSIGGYAVMVMANGDIDTIIDPVKGNPWIEYCLWGPAAESLGFVVTDPEGRPIDRAAIMRKAIEKNLSNASSRVRFVISRTPEIHKRVLELLKSSGPQAK